MMSAYQSINQSKYIHIWCWFAWSMYLVKCSTRWELVQYDEYPSYLCIFIALQLCFGLAPSSEAITKMTLHFELQMKKTNEMQAWPFPSATPTWQNG